jgi:hypothetical protein
MANVEHLRTPPQRPDHLDALGPEERAVIAAIRETRFGAVEIVVHQSRIVQLMRSEKVRFDHSATT